MLPEFVYKILDMDAWDDALNAGEFKGAAIDLKDGYIHFSTMDQVRETAAKHFGGQKNLFLIKISTAPMARHYKMEVSRGGALFPHLYANLPVSNAVEWSEMTLDENGIHVLPQEFVA